MRYLLDTNLVSEPTRPQPDRRVLHWITQHAESDAAISVITVLETEKGALLRQRRDPDSAMRLRQWIDEELVQGYAGRILPVDLAVARRAAALHVPAPMPQHDALIAATAIVHDLTLVTRNARDFAHTGVRCIDPWAL